jgi:hypothetical protein
MVRSSIIVSVQLQECRFLNAILAEVRDDGSASAEDFWSASDRGETWLTPSSIIVSVQLQVGFSTLFWQRFGTIGLPPLEDFWSASDRGLRSASARGLLVCLR